MMRTVAIAGAAAVVAGQPSFTAQCVLDLNNQGIDVTYDLSSMIGLSLNVQDQRNDTDLVAFDTWFGVCKDIVPRSDFLSTCQQTQGDNGQVTYGSGSIFQVDQRNNICHRLGGNASAGIMNVFLNGTVRGSQDRLWARGVTLSYTGGDVCTDWLTGVEYPRNTTIVWECYDNPVAPMATIVREDVTCNYTIFIKSRHGCPTQCRGEGRMCNGHGICGYDASNAKAKCYCNSGWEGDPLCGTFIGVDPVKPQPSYGGNIAAGFFGGLFGGVILVFGYLAVKTKMAGGAWKDVLNPANVFAGGAGCGGCGGLLGGGGGIGNAYSYAKAPEAPAFAGASLGAADYAPPPVDAGSAPAYAPPADGPMLA